MKKAHLDCWLSELRKFTLSLDLSAPICTFEELFQMISKTSNSLLGSLTTSIESLPCLSSNVPSPSACLNVGHSIMERALGQESEDKFSSPYTQSISWLTLKTSLEFFRPQLAQLLDGANVDLFQYQNQELGQDNPSRPFNSPVSMNKFLLLLVTQNHHQQGGDKQETPHQWMESIWHPL